MPACLRPQDLHNSGKKGCRCNNAHQVAESLRLSLFSLLDANRVNVQNESGQE